MNSKKTYKYKAFISYSHADKKIVNKIFNSIEKYTIPLELRKKYYHLPKKLYPLFRDLEELSTSSNLSKKIIEALKDSEYLIVICSPHSVKSEWVNKEIIDFKKLYGEDRVLAFIIAGEPNASEIDGVDSALECFPRALRYKIDSNGNLTDKKTEPLAADARDGQGGLEFAKLKLIAGLLEIDFNELYQREERRKKQQRIIWGSISVALILIFAGFGFFSYNQWKIAEKARNQSENLSGFMLTSLRDKLKTVGRLDILKESIDRAGKYYNNIKIGQDAKRSRNAYRFYIDSGDIYIELKDLEKALKMYNKALNIVQLMEKKNPKNLSWKNELSICTHKMGNIFMLLGKYEKAKKFYEKSLKTIKYLLQQEPQNLIWKRNLAVEYEKISDYYIVKWQMKKALTFLEKSLKEREELVKINPKDEKWQRDLANTYQRIGYVYSTDESDINEAEKYYKKQIDIIKSLANNNPTNFQYKLDLAVSLNQIGDFYYLKKQDLNKTKDYYNQSINIKRNLTQRDPTNLLWQNYLAIGYEKLGNFQLQLNKKEEAKYYYEKSLSIMEKLVSLEPKDATLLKQISISYENMGRVFLKMEKFDKSQEFYEKSLNIREDLVQQNKSNLYFQKMLSVIYENIGNLYFKKRDLYIGENFYKKSIDILENLIQQDNKNISFKNSLSYSYYELYKQTKNKFYIKKFVTIMRELKQQGALSESGKAVLKDSEKLIF